MENSGTTQQSYGFIDLQQLTENAVYDKSLDEHLSVSADKSPPSPPPIDPSKLLDKRLSHQFTVGGSLMNHNGIAKDKDKDKETYVFVRFCVKSNLDEHNKVVEIKTRLVAEANAVICCNYKRRLS